MKYRAAARLLIVACAVLLLALPALAQRGGRRFVSLSLPAHRRARQVRRPVRHRPAVVPQLPGLGVRLPGDGAEPHADPE